MHPLNRFLLFSSGMKPNVSMAFTALWASGASVASNSWGGNSFLALRFPITNFWDHQFLPFGYFDIYRLRLFQTFPKHVGGYPLRLTQP